MNLLSTTTGRAEPVGRRARASTPSSAPLSIERSTCCDVRPRRGWRVEVDDERREEDVHRARAGRAAPVPARDDDAQPAALALGEAEVLAVGRAAPAVRVDAGALGAQAVRMRQLDQAPGLGAAAGAVVVLAARTSRRSRRTASPRRRRRTAGRDSPDRPSSRAFRPPRGSAPPAGPGPSTVPSRLPTRDDRAVPELEHPLRVLVGLALAEVDRRLLVRDRRRPT